MGDFNTFIEELKTNLLQLANGSFQAYAKQILADGAVFASKLEEDLKRWGTEYAIHEITKEEFEFLVKSKKDLLEMEALKQEGLARTELNKLRNSIVKTVMETAIKFLF
jgi:hypothetical protein